ncbi:MAG: endolytic transglycosylase MltG [Alphaproteobacteria bacterium]|nr:endolytic transglycosylase MltG [Alphaproteobacteria bacterium]
MPNTASLSKPMRFVLFLLALLVLAALVVATAIGWGIKYYNSPGPNDAKTTVIIPKGTGFAGITQLLDSAGVIKHPKAFSAIAVVLEKAKKVQAGEYAFPANVPPKDVLESLVQGKTVIHRITIPEGLTTREVIAMVEEEDKLQGTIPGDIKEGELLPETYYFSRGDSRGEIVTRMRKSMRVLLLELWDDRHADLPYRTPQEAITLASIVEKETSLNDEYGKVASVYINRLRKDMKLQADPTVIYAITLGQEDFNRRVLYSDLRRESPYNTYTSKGLPPGPIANPGKMALIAALSPPETDYIFFVADGTGGHNFSITYAQHSKYVKQFRKLLSDQRKNVKKTTASDSSPPENIVPEVKPIIGTEDE